MRTSEASTKRTQRQPAGPRQAGATPVAPDHTAATAGSTKRAYRFREFCEIYGIGKMSAYEAIRQGDLIAHKRGKATIVLADDAEAYIASLPRLELPPATERDRAA